MKKGAFIMNPLNGLIVYRKINVYNPDDFQKRIMDGLFYRDSSAYLDHLGKDITGRVGRILQLCEGRLKTLTVRF